jgi:hypothetical protein
MIDRSEQDRLPGLSRRQPETFAFSSIFRCLHYKFS